MLTYCKELTAKAVEINASSESNVSTAHCLEAAPNILAYDMEHGPSKRHRHTDSLQLHWSGPYQALLTNARVAG